MAAALFAIDRIVDSFAIIDVNLCFLAYSGSTLCISVFMICLFNYRYVVNMIKNSAHLLLRLSRPFFEIVKGREYFQFK